MSSLFAPMRPPIQRLLPFGADEALRRVSAHLEAAACPCHGTLARRHIELLISEDQRHFWSPWLSIELEDRPDTSTELRGRFGPHPHVWTMFMFGYAVLTFLGLIGVTLGLSQLALGESAWGLWALPVSTVGGLGLYLGSQLGQRLGADQIHLLEGFVDDALATAVDAAAADPAPADATVVDASG